MMSSVEGHRRVRLAFRRARAFLSDHRRRIAMVAAPLFVASLVLLVLDQVLPFPRPGERMMYTPRGWPAGWAVMRAPAGGGAAQEIRPGLRSRGGVGGASYALTPLSFMSYRVKPGDTITGIAGRLGMDPDTISSLNRSEGRGVHSLTVGEEISIPNQDGIYMAVNGDLDALCRKLNSQDPGLSLDPDAVLGINGMSRSSLKPGTRLFFPGVQHRGWLYSLSLGVAVINPLRGGWESSGFGIRRDPFTGEQTRHRGVDIAASEGTTVRSASAGRVSYVGYNDVLGNFIQVRAPMGFTYIYGHLSAAWVQPGTRVAQGTPIGAVGSTGKATGPHLHFEVWKNGALQNPARYMPGIR
jgi:murein DD-endopeptidase MepM/ murein hydrolase activator NlpD